MLRLEGIDKTYLSRLHDQKALKDVNLHIREGEFVAIVGPSGGGKSTLLSILGCLDKADRGRYFLKDQLVVWGSDRQLSQIRGGQVATIFQGFELIPHWTVAENVAISLRFRKIPQRERLRYIQPVLKDLGLFAYSQKFPHELSGGEQQRVAIARALCSEPQVILADEPTGNLDPDTADHIFGLFLRLHEQGKTIVFVTHDPMLAGKAQRIVRIEKGRIVAGGL